uniref:Uncharacterized protein n=1 Tax=Arundo donax TaxID=35708 RepID=A0A0A8ZF37_ARUDO
MNSSSVAYSKLYGEFHDLGFLCFSFEFPDLMLDMDEEYYYLFNVPRFH